MFDESDIIKPGKNDITLGCDLSTFSLDDIDERIALLKDEIERLQNEKKNKSASLSQAEAFFKS